MILGGIKKKLKYTVNKQKKIVIIKYYGIRLAATGVLC